MSNDPKRRAEARQKAMDIALSATPGTLVDQLTDALLAFADAAIIAENEACERVARDAEAEWRRDADDVKARACESLADAIADRRKERK